MISRRKIISRSRDDITYFTNHSIEDDQENWHNKDKLCRDHIKEVLNKWAQIDDEIWAKIIVMERNHRVAKAYARSSVITINGSKIGFDGYRIGINGLDNGVSDPKVYQIKKLIGQGIKLKMDESGNILIKRITRCCVYVKSWTLNFRKDNSISEEIIKNNGKLDADKAYKLFDMKKFQSNMDRELRNAYPDRKKLEAQCISIFSFAKELPDILDLPCYIMIINIVALDILRSKFLIASDRTLCRFSPLIEEKRDVIDDICSEKSESTSSAKSSVFNQSSKKFYPPQKIPQKNLPIVKDKIIPFKLPSPDYDNENENDEIIKPRINKTQHQIDDPYYCGLKAKLTCKKNDEKITKHQIIQSSPSCSSSSLSSFGEKVAEKNSKMRKSQSTNYLNSFISLGPLYPLSSDYSLDSDIYSSIRGSLRSKEKRSSFMSFLRSSIANNKSRSHHSHSSQIITKPLHGRYWKY